MANPFDQFDEKNPFDQFDVAPEKTPLLETLRNGLATAPINMYLGAKQMFGGLDPIEQNVLAQNKAAERAAPITSFVSNIATAVPAAMIPGANTLAGAGLAGAAQGLFQPVEGDQTLGNIAKGKAINTALGGAMGTAGQAAANKVVQFASGLRGDAAQQAALRAPKDAVLAEGRAAGYVVPGSEVAPTFLGNKLESLGGKAAIKQEATIRNQGATNALARKALGLAADEPITPGALEKIRTAAGQTYDEVAKLSPQAAKDLEALKSTRAEAKGWFDAYNRSMRPDDLAKAKALQAEADTLEGWIDWHAVSGGRQDLLPELIKARKEIAKSYTVERALNKSTGDVDARVIGRLFDKQKPLSDGLDTIGKFQQAYPKFTSPAVNTPAPGVNYLDAVSMPALAMGGAAVTGGPAGMLAAGIPLLRGPARSMVLSQAMQKPAQYGPGRIGNGLLNFAPAALPVLTRGAVPLTAGLLAGQ